MASSRTQGEAVRWTAGGAAASLIAAMIVTGVAAPGVSAPSTVTQSFGYTGAVQTFTVPAGVTALTISVRGGQGGNGGADATPAPDPGTYAGTVTGTIPVTPGQQLQIAVGSGGTTGVSKTNGASSQPAPGGNNPLDGYDGGRGGQAGTKGSSGQGGAGGAASVLVVGDQHIVAGGGGGNGGSGQYAPTRGRNATEDFVPRADATSTSGQAGADAATACAAATCNNDDGGGSGGGGGGAQGGAQGQIEFGAGTSNEWFGYGGSVGSNSVGGFSALVSGYVYAAQNSGNGAIVLSYETGTPAAPSAVQGTAGIGAVDLTWVPPTASGGAAVSEYAIRYSSDGGATWSEPILTRDTATSATVDGLTNDTAYIFQVAAVSSLGRGDWSPSSAPITSRDLPSAPAITAVEPRDGALALTVAPPATGATPTGYEYRVDGGPWLPAAGATSPVVVPGLVNGQEYAVEVRAISAVGAGAASEPAAGTPIAVPGAPTIDSAVSAPGAIRLWATPGYTGGSPITRYEVQIDGGAWEPVGLDIAPLALTGLDDGTAYEVRLRAVNDAGPGAASAPLTVTTPGAPGPLTDVVAHPGDGQASIDYALGATNGSPITRVWYSLDGVDYEPAPLTGPLLLTGLTNGDPVTVHLRAENAVGTGPSTSVTVTPITTPGAPTVHEGSVAGSDGALTVDFSAPGSDGGSPVTGYEYSTDGGLTWHARDDGGALDSPLVITAESSDGTTPLVNGETYLVQIRAVNAAGAAPASSVAPGVPVESASAPVITTVRPQPGALAVTFTPGPNGGSEVLRYEYSLDGGDTWRTTGSLSRAFTITGLTNGTPYDVIVRTVTSVGDGPASAPVSGTPATVPDAPALTSIVRGDRTLSVDVDPAGDGGSPLTGWEYTTDGGATWLAATVDGDGPVLLLTTPSDDDSERLLNGRGYAVQVRAVNAVGAGASSAPLYAAPASAPPAPTVTATAGDGTVTVAFGFADDGGSPLTAVEYSLDGGATWIDPGTLIGPFVLTGLPNGERVDVRVRGVNAIGDGAPSAPASATPRTVPGAPTGVQATSNTASADVTWTAPDSDGGAPITGYRAIAYASTSSEPPAGTCTTSGALSCTIPGLTNGTPFYVVVEATNAAGTGPQSTPRIQVTPLQRPSAPSLTGLTTGDRMLRASFTAGSLGGGTFLRYEYTLDGGATWATLPGGGSPATIPDLTNGTPYTVQLRTVTTAGPSPWSNARTATPYGYPGVAPDIIADARNGQVVVSWGAADPNGGTIADYTATAFSAESGGTTVTTCTTAALTCTLTGLTNGTTYYISVQTRNTASMYSARSDRVPATPSTLPSAPRDLEAEPGDGEVRLTWDPPMGQGASAITGYDVYCAVAGGAPALCGTTTGTEFTVPDLTNGTSYRFHVVARNSQGAGPASASVDAVPRAAGVAPVLSSATAQAGGFTVTIENFDADTTYALAVPDGATATRSGAVVTVSGLADGASAELTVTAQKVGFTDAAASRTGTALPAGIAPTFGAPTATADGYTVTITNLDPDATYAFSAPHGVTVTRDGDVLTVTGVAPGATAAVVVTATAPGARAAGATVTGSALEAGVAPVLSAFEREEGGFTVEIENLDPDATYDLAVTAGTVTRSGAVLTVTGLADGQSAQVTVTARKAGSTDAAASRTGVALDAGVAPVFSTPVRTEDGYTVRITNHDATASYVVTGPHGVTVTRDGDLLTVAGLEPGDPATLDVTVTAAGARPATATVIGRALDRGAPPVLIEPRSLAGGFSYVILNYDPDAEYILTVSGGATVTRKGPIVTVSGLEPGQTAELTIVARVEGCTDASVTVSGHAVAAAHKGSGKGGGLASTGGTLATVAGATAAGAAALVVGLALLVRRRRHTA